MANKYLILFIILLAILLRWYHIDFLSLWYDEGDTIFRSANFFEYIPKYITYQDGEYNNISASIHSIFDIHGLSVSPPLYFFVMNIWVQSFGITETAVRSFSALFGALAVLLVYWLTKKLFAPKTALIAAFLFAINSYNVVYSQEARTYTFLVALGLGAAYSCYSLLETRQRRWWIALTIINVLGIYTHTHFIFLIAAEIAFFLFHFSTYRAALKTFVLSLAASALLYLPWLPHFYYANQYARQFYWLNVFHIVDAPLTYIVFGIGQTLIQKESAVWAIILVTFLYGIGFGIPAIMGIFKDMNSEKKQIAFLLTFAIVPVIIPALLSQFYYPIFQWQYVMVAAPAFIILVARGLTHLRFAPFFLIIIIGLSAASLAHYYTIPIFKGDYRAAVSIIQQNEQPNDIIIVHSPQIIPLFNYYYRGTLPVVGFPSPSEPLNGQNIIVTLENLETLPALVSGYKRMWVIERLVHDPDKLLVPYLDTHYTRLYFNQFVWIRVYLYQIN